MGTATDCHQRNPQARRVRQDAPIAEVQSTMCQSAQSLKYRRMNARLARDCPSKPQAPSNKRSPARNNKRPPARANNLEKALDQISFMVEKVPPDHKPSSSREEDVTMKEQNP